MVNCSVIEKSDFYFFSIEGYLEIKRCVYVVFADCFFYNI